MIPRLEQRPRPRSRQQLSPSQPPWPRRWLSTPRSTRPRRRLRTPLFQPGRPNPNPTRPLPAASLLMGFCTRSASLDRRRPCHDTPPGSRVSPGRTTACRPTSAPPTHVGHFACAAAHERDRWQALVEPGSQGADPPTARPALPHALSRRIQPLPRPVCPACQQSGLAITATLEPPLRLALGHPGLRRGGRWQSPVLRPRRQPPFRATPRGCAVAGPGGRLSGHPGEICPTTPAAARPPTPMPTWPICRGSRAPH